MRTGEHVCIDLDKFAPDFSTVEDGGINPDYYDSDSSFAGIIRSSADTHEQLNQQI